MFTYRDFDDYLRQNTVETTTCLQCNGKGYRLYNTETDKEVSEIEYSVLLESERYKEYCGKCEGTGEHADDSYDYWNNPFTLRKMQIEN
jgi:predicted MarR family transcription regulator